MSLNLSNKNILDVTEIFNEINSPEKYTFIDLSNNLLTSLPTNISKFISLTSLNITNNKFSDYNAISQILSSLPLLQDLSIDLATQENVIIILSALPGLIKLNGQKTEENTNSLQQSFISNKDDKDFLLNEKKKEISLNEETEEFEFIYKEINNEEFNKKFQEKLREEINKINNNLDISNKLYNAIIVKSKLDIYSFILDEVLNIIIHNDSNSNTNFNNNKILKIVNLVKDKLKYNYNILFELILNNNDTDNNSDKILTEKIVINPLNNNINEKKYKYEISNDITLLDSLTPYYTEENNDINDINKIKIMPKSDIISLLDQIYNYYNKNKENNFNNFEEASISFLTAKYGMKSIAEFWYKKIREGINYFTENNELDNYSEIYLVKKILENKIDEYFYIKYKKIKMKYANYLKNIKTLFENNKNKENITYEEGIKIFMNNLNDIIDNNELNKDDILDCLNKKKKNYDDNIINNLCNDFINVLLELQIKKRENKYNIFLTKFKIYDTNDDGYISKGEFIELIYSFKNELIYKNINVISELCSELFKSNKKLISINNCIETLSKSNISNVNIYDILFSFT